MPNTTAMMQQSIDLRFWAQAKREAYDRGIHDAAAIERIMESIRFREYQRAIEPYLRCRTSIVSAWVTLHARYEPIPESMTKFWDDMITDEARKFGYQP